MRRRARNGCYRCGQPTEVTVQVWMREFIDDKDRSGNRKQKSVKARNVSMCREHGDEFFEHCVGDIPADTQLTNNTSDMAHARAKIGGR